MAWTGIASAAGLGGINVTSALGQPLKAQIDVVSVDKSDKSTLRAKLASPDEYNNAGIDYPYNVPKLKFELAQRSNGEEYIKVTSAQPVNEPFVTLMVELSWASGKLLREYTFLLDPVGYKPETPAPETLQPIEPVLAVPEVAAVPETIAASAPVAAAPQTEAALTNVDISAPAPASAAAAAPAMAMAAPASEVPAAPAMASEVAAAPTEMTTEAAAPAAASSVPEAAPALTEQALEPENAPAAAPVQPAMEDALSKEEALAEAAPVAPPSDQIVVVRGDTLGKIAAQIKPPDVSLERMLVALYRENAAVFDAHNMNRIRAGKILHIPSEEAIRAQPQADAVEEIRAQAADWNVYRQKLAAARAARAESEAKQETAGKITTAVTDKAVANKAPSKEVLKLSKGEAPNDKLVGGGKSTSQEQAVAKEENEIAKGKALQEAEKRTAILEKNVQDLKRLAELKKQTASAPVAAAAATPASAPKAAVPAKPKPVVKPRVAVPQPVEPPSLIDQLMEDPLYLAGGAGALVLLGVLSIMIMRRGRQGGVAKAKPSKKKKKSVEDEGSATGRMAAPIMPSPETGDFTQVSTPSAAPMAEESEEVDPIGEADLFLTFGRDAQAEEVLKEALKKNPNNIPVKLKLLSIYVTRKDTNSFYTYAREVKESGDESAWAQTAAMGRDLDPSNPLYGGDAGAAPAGTSSAPAAQAAAGVDLDLGFGAPAAAPSNQDTVVLESPAADEKTTIISPEDLKRADTTGSMDFDITGTNPGTPAAAISAPAAEAEADDLVFDVTSTHPNVPVQTATGAAAPALDDSMTFTLDFPTETNPTAAVPSKDMGLDEITLNLDKTGTNPVSGSTDSKDERWQEVATKLDLAKAYQEMGDAAGAREILEEVLRDGDEDQRGTAQTLMQQL